MQPAGLALSGSGVAHDLQQSAPLGEISAGPGIIEPV
jgi:hypothetical protein